MAVLSNESHAKLDELPAFRHRERHSYATNLEPARVLAMAEAVAPAVTMFATEVERFLAMLEQEPPAFP